MMTPETLSIQPAAVRQPLLQGRQPVAGLWWPYEDWRGDIARARRLLAHWRVGASAWRFAQGDLLRYPTAQETQCEALGGWPLCLQGKTLCSAPLTRAEAAALPVADIWLVQGGQVSALHMRDAQVLDPAQWLAIDELVLHDTYDCRAALPPPLDLTAMDVRDLREVLKGQVPPASPEQREFLRALAQQRLRKTSSRSPGRPAQDAHREPSRSQVQTSWRWWPYAAAVLGLALLGVALNAADVMHLGILKVLAIFVALWLFLRRWFKSDASWTIITEPVPAPPPIQPAITVPERATRSVLPQAWRRWLARLAVTTQLSRLLGMRQAAYMRKMLALFESGQLEEALRHAIPLGGEGTSLGQSFGAPSARDKLELSRGGSSNVSIHLGEDLETYLRRLYRQSFDKLDREGRIDEAVFVLAELLNAQQEALDYLEKHQRYAQAAELALAWDSPSDVIVRLHCLAGDWRHAIAVARRDKSFANAVIQLEKQWPDAAARLRLEWAQWLTARGDWLGAVEAIWPLPAQRELATQWLLTAESAGGHLAARALVKRAVLLPETWVDCSERLQDLRDDTERHTERAAIVQAVLALKERTAPIRQLTQIVLPAVLADQSSVRAQLGKNDLQEVMKLADPWLLADMPKGALPTQGLQALGTNKDVLAGQLPDAGGLAILDAVALDAGQHLIALGEAGAAVIDKRGKIISRFTVPAERIVLAHSRQVALVLAQRDGLSRVSRLDIARRQVFDLGMAELAHVATAFDGIAWTVAHGTRLRVLDTQHSLQEVLWQVTDLPGPVRALSVNADVEQLVVEDETGQLELWRYGLPARRLLARGETLPERLPHTALRLLHPHGGIIDILKGPCDEALCNISCHWQQFSGARGEFLIAAQLEDVDNTLQVHAVVNAHWLLMSIYSKTVNQVHVISLQAGKIQATVPWAQGIAPQLRLEAEQCIVFDEQGRLWSLDSATSGTQSLSIQA